MSTSVAADSGTRAPSGSTSATGKFAGAIAALDQTRERRRALPVVGMQAMRSAARP